MPTVEDATIEKLKAETLKPLATYEEHKGFTSQPDVNPNYIVPKMFMFRLQKLMDEYAGGVGSQFTTSQKLLEKGLELLGMLKEDAANLGAEDLHQLMRCWENVHRMYQAEAHMRTILYREETRWPGYYFRADFPKLDNDNWLCFVNCKMDPVTGEWEMFKRDIIPMFKGESDHELLGG